MFLCHLISIKHKYEVTNQKTINQSSSGLITLVTDVLTAKETIMQIDTKYIPNKMQDSTFADTDFFYFSSFIFQENHVFMKDRNNPSERVVMDETGLDGIEIGGI